MLVERAATAEAVLVGELHGQPHGQAFLAAFFADLIEAAPGAAAALEFFERDQQVALDDYLAGITDDAAFRVASGRKSESSYPIGHRAIVEACLAAGRPVIAANAPRRYVRTARLAGYDRLRALPPEVTRLIRLPEAPASTRYADDFAMVMAGVDLRKDDPPRDATPEERSKAEAAFRAQSVWDWTMADSVARAIGPADAARGRPVVLVVGGFHVGHGGGLVQALARVRPGTRVLVINMVDATPLAPPDAALRADERGLADVIVYVGQ